MNKSNKVIGEKTEAMILARLVQLGYAVSVPFGNNQRYDLVVDDGLALKKAQCKTGRLRDGVVQFDVCSKNGFTGERKTYHGEIDEFLVYCHENGSYYRVPVQEVGVRQAVLRVEPAKNNQAYSVKWAADYELK